MVARDVNHPSVLFWANGNEGGENTENDDEFAKHDPQKRPVLHPWALSFRNLNTYHYRPYADTSKYVEGPDLFMPTEFLHGLYDGGHGAGLDDYWKLMGEKPHAAGGFLWGCGWTRRLPAPIRAGDSTPTMTWAPMASSGRVTRRKAALTPFAKSGVRCRFPWTRCRRVFSGRLPVRNRYDFLNLSGVTFEWRLWRYTAPGTLLYDRQIRSHGRLAGPDLAPRADGELTLPLPEGWREDADVLYLTAIDAQARELWTWSWRWKHGAAAIGRGADRHGGGLANRARRRDAREHGPERRSI